MQRLLPLRKPPRILKALLGGLNYGDDIFAEIDAEIKAIEEAEAQAEEEESLEGTEVDTAEPAPESDDTDDTDLGTLADLESFTTNGGSDILMEDQEILNAVFAIFKDKFKDEFNFIDED